MGQRGPAWAMQWGIRKAQRALCPSEKKLVARKKGKKERDVKEA